MNADSLARLRRSLVSFVFRMQSGTGRTWVVEVHQLIPVLYCRNFEFIYKIFQLVDGKVIDINN